MNKKEINHYARIGVNSCIVQVLKSNYSSELKSELIESFNNDLKGLVE